MFDLSLAEILLIVVVALVFIGPKELPVVAGAVAKALRSLRGLAGELRAAFDDMTRESGFKDVTDELDGHMRMIRGEDGKMYKSYDMTLLEKDAGVKPPQTRMPVVPAEDEEE